jgi:hypothetical protein
MVDESQIQDPVVASVSVYMVDERQGWVLAVVDSPAHPVSLVDPSRETDIDVSIAINAPRNVARLLAAIDWMPPSQNPF